MRDRIDEVMNQTHRYYYEDGLVELGVGILFLVIGLLLGVWARAATASPLFLAAVLGATLLVLGGGFAMKRAVGRIKERVTYPRTGYVSYHGRQPAPGRWLIIAAAIGLVVLGFVFPDWLFRMPMMQGLLLCVILVYMGYRVRLGRLYLVGLIAAAVGLGATLLIPDEILGSSVVFGGAGVALLLSGACTLRGDLQAHPEAREDVP